MGFLDRFRSPRLVASDANVSDGWHEGGGWLRWEPPRNVVVEGHYQEALSELCGGLCKEGFLVPVPVDLTREPANPYDSNAVAARAGRAGAQVGYLRREVAAQIGPALDQLGLRSWTVCGVIRGGRPRAQHLGVHLWLGRRVTPGPSVEFDPGPWEIPWPPTDGEWERSIRTLAANG